MLGNRKTELDRDCQGTGGTLIYLALLLGVGWCPHPTVLPAGLGGQVSWRERHFPFPGGRSQGPPENGAHLVGSKVPHCIVSVLFPTDT